MARAHIVIGTLLWKRHEVFRVWAEALLDAATHPFSVVVAGSEGESSRALVESYGFHYMETPNQPLGAKANERLRGCRDLEPDYVVLTGSDDIVCPATFARYRHLAEQGVDEVAINDIYHLNALTGELAYSRGYTNHRRGEPVAPWRMLSRRLCEQVGWRLWDSSAPVHLDGHSYRRLRDVDHEEHRLHLRDEGLFVCDIKSLVNMTPWAMRENWETVDRSVLEGRLSARVQGRLAALQDALQGAEGTELGVDHLRALGQHNRATPVRIEQAPHGTWHVFAEAIAGAGSAGKGANVETALCNAVERAMARMRGEPQQRRAILLALKDALDAYDAGAGRPRGGHVDGSGI
jgi:hypothetical protein